MEIRDELERIFSDNGIDVTDKSQLANIDSLTYILLLTEIEQKYDIIFPDDFLGQNVATDFGVFVSCVSELIKDANENGAILSISTDNNP